MIVNSDSRLATALAEISRLYAEHRYLDVKIRLGKDRNAEQNAKMWAMLGDIAEQVDWLVDGDKVKLNSEDWKIILTAGLKKNQRVAKGIDGGFVMLGSSTKKMKIAEMVELIEFILWFGAEHAVIWSDEL